jgi:DNA-binding NtrC family response regulator
MNKRILVVDDDQSIRETFQHHLTRLGYDTTVVNSAAQALGCIAEVDPALVITDVRMDGMSGLELLRKLREVMPDLNVVVITAHEDMQTAVSAMRAGAYDFLVKPLDLTHIELVIQRAVRDRALRQRVKATVTEQAEDYRLDAMIGTSPKMIDIYKIIGTLASNRAAVLIRGETGTGKEVIARAIHYNSDSEAEPFVAVNCTAVPEPLLESELFGHLRGSFTGAVGDRRGRFELAGAGTIFLDEIGDVSAAFQAKLLRVLQEREFYPVGSERARRSDARVIAATHRPIEEMVARGEFREDLYFRLRVVEIMVPPLRERREDIPLLVDHIVKQAADNAHRRGAVVSAGAMQVMKQYPWPGNVRELENALTRAVALAPGGVITAETLGLKAVATPAADASTDDTLAGVEKRHIETVLARVEGNKRQACRILRVTRPRLDRLIERYAIEVMQRGRRSNGS